MSRGLRLMIYDDTCRGRPGLPGLIHSWQVGAHLYRGLGRLDGWIGVSSWEAGLRWLVETGPAEPIAEVNPIMMEIASASPIVDTPSPQKMPPIPQPIPNRTAETSAQVGQLAKTSPRFGMVRKATGHGMKTSAISEPMPHVFSNSHLGVI